MSMPPSSPRLPSPPPAAEIQVTPNSPSGGPAATLQATEMEQTVIDAHSKRRIHPGTKSADMATGPPLVPLAELDSAFSLQEHLAALHYHHTAQGTRQVDRTTALQLTQPPTGIDRTLWLYELCRFLIAQCNTLVVGFLFDTPPCSASTCPEMRASEWQFLCAVHEQPKSCCAIDYCCHTLDWAANVVSDQKLFPSRCLVVSDPHSKNVGVKNLVNVFRRLHRIFAHAWFQHRDVFWTVEGQTGLYVFFKTVCDIYDLLPAENYKLPPEAEGLEAESAEEDSEQQLRPTILKPPLEPSVAEPESEETDNSHLSAARTNTRRHIRSSPSTGSAVTTVIEADEDEADALSRGIDSMSIASIAPDDVTPLPSAIPSEAKTLEMILDSKYDEPELPPSATHQKLPPPDPSEEEEAPATVDTHPPTVPSASDAKNDEGSEEEGHAKKTEDTEEHIVATVTSITDDATADATKPTNPTTNQGEGQTTKHAKANESGTLETSKSEESDLNKVTTGDAADESAKDAA
ncbi:Putative Mob1/phocein family protein [[Torrubiella] hemipterigena]|uniref:Putative Mob1/phocein family protein n=1 Tax=[Torrubiella] hemipterigena TaxID=1531966 RepID=A0A0A1SYS5_9HYPO|nr:Putative Mob1/phocein family protein [[Torrubiella] hemipterigena]